MQRFYLVIIVLLLLLSISLAHSINRYSKTQTGLIQKYNDEIFNLKLRNVELTKCINILLKCENVKLNENLVVYDKNENMFTLKEIVYPFKWKMVCYVSKEVCETCNDSILLKIKSLTEKIGTENILVIIPYSRFRELYLFFQQNSINLNLYGIKNPSLGVTDVDNNIMSPFYFVLDSELICHNIFLADKNNPELIANYLNIMVDLFFKTSN